jgi:peptidoglycan-N-acetylglucosamine deacetylase
MLPYLIGGAGIAAAAGAAAYHSMSPRSQLYGETFIGTPGRGKQLALTYDDGPNDPHTLRLLDVLAKHDVKATFFLIGNFVLQQPGIVQDIIGTGHEIGNHTFSHPVLSLCDRGNTISEISSCTLEIKLAAMGFAGRSREELRELVGSSPVGFSSELGALSKLFRPPFGARRPATLRIARQMGFTPVMWSVWCFDWKETTADRVEAHAVKNISGGDVILLHDGGHKRMGTDRSHTVEATDRIIRRYKDQGFEFVSVSQMMASAPKEPTPKST